MTLSEAQKAKKKERKKAKASNDKYIKLLEDKATALESTLKMLEKEVAQLKNELTDVRMVNQRLLSENKRIDSDLQGMKTEWERSKVRSSVGAWLELARRQILQNYGQLESDTAQAQIGQIWHNVVVVGIMKNGTSEERTTFWNVVDTLFDLTKADWEHLAAFYRNERCEDVYCHYRPPAEESLRLLDALPETYLPTRAIFVRLIKKADENETAVDDSPYDIVYR